MPEAVFAQEILLDTSNFHYEDRSRRDCVINQLHYCKIITSFNGGKQRKVIASNKLTCIHLKPHQGISLCRLHNRIKKRLRMKNVLIRQKFNYIFDILDLKMRKHTE